MEYGVREMCNWMKARQWLSDSTNTHSRTHTFELFKWHQTATSECRRHPIGRSIFIFHRLQSFLKWFFPHTHTRTHCRRERERNDREYKWEWEICWYTALFNYYYCFSFFFFFRCFFFVFLRNRTSRPTDNMTYMGAYALVTHPMYKVVAPALLLSSSSSIRARFVFSSFDHTQQQREPRRRQ